MHRYLLDHLHRLHALFHKRNVIQRLICNCTFSALLGTKPLLISMLHLPHILIELLFGVAHQFHHTSNHLDRSMKCTVSFFVAASVDSLSTNLCAVVRRNCLAAMKFRHFCRCGTDEHIGHSRIHISTSHLPENCKKNRK